MNNIDVTKLKDHKFYLEHFCKIKTKKGGLHPFILNESQKDLFNTLNKYNRIIILKCRQLGFSTGVAGYFYVDTITTPGITTALVGYNAEMVTELFDKIKTFYKTTPTQMRPEIQYDTKTQISFPRMHSKIMVLPCTKDVGRGYTLHRVLLTELSSWDDAETKFMGLLESIPESGKLVIESTPRGMGNLYHRLWATKNNDYKKKRYDWWWGYTKEQMDKKRKEIGELAFAQEYGNDFLASGRSVFDRGTIKMHRRNILKVGDENRELVIDDYISPKQTVREDGHWIIYRDVHLDGIYVIGSDVSEGVEGGDYSAAIIWDRRTGEEVALFHGLLPPDELAKELNRMGRLYNNALMVVEINNQGILTVTKLRDMAYPTPYFRPAKFETMGTSLSDRLGWKTNRATRPILIGDFYEALRQNALIIHSEILINEMSTFTYDENGNMISEKGMHDDCLFAAGIGFQGFKVISPNELTQIDYKKYLPKSFSY